MTTFLNDNDDDTLDDEYIDIDPTLLKAALKAVDAYAAAVDGRPVTVARQSNRSENWLRTL